MSNQWNKDIHDRLKDFPKKAPEGLLDEIKEEMALRGLDFVSTQHKSSHTLSPAILRIASIAAFLLLLTGISFIWEKEAGQSIENIHTRLPEVAEPIPFPNMEAPKDEQIASVPNKPMVTKVQKESTSVSETQPTEEENIPNETEEEKDIEKDSINNAFPSPQPVQNNKQTPRKKKQTYALSHKKKSAFAVSIFYSGIITSGNGNPLLFTSANRNDDNGYGASDPNWDPSEDPNQGGQQPNDSTSTSPESRTLIREAFKEKEKHRLPLKFGVSFRYNLNKRWNIQSGVTYTYLSSDLNRYNTEVSYITTQKLHYIGIPLQVGYKLWESKRFRAYAAAGGQVEKLISGRATTEHFVKGKYQNASTQKVKDKHLLFSALGSIGAEYALGENVSLYAEPGIHYHFKNGSSLKTYYTEHPLKLNITLGIRLHWGKE